jgi:hypothetical protein
LVPKRQVNRPTKSMLVDKTWRMLPSDFIH